MDEKRYKYYYSEAVKNRMVPNVISAIENQTKLSEKAQVLINKRFEIEDKLYETYHSVYAEGIDKVLFEERNLPEHERAIQMMKFWVNNDPKLNIIREAVKKSGKQEEINRLENVYQNILFKSYRALINLDFAINESREKLFSDEYKLKMKEYADKGVLLYFLETPDAPILTKDFTIDDFLESLSFGGYLSLKTLFSSFLSQKTPSSSMARKIDDIYSALDCLECRQYRSAARTVFALLESEHKNCSSAMDNYFTLDARIRKGKQRAEKIEKLLNGLKEQTYFSKVWDIVNPIYRDILNSKADSFIDRNSIIHGDYYSDKLDITEKDVIKLLLLFINMRMISDHIQLYCDMFKNSLSYVEIQMAQKLKSVKK